MGRESGQPVSPIATDGEMCTPIVRLVALSIEHAPATAGWMDDPLIARGIGLRREPSLESTRDWIRRAHADPTIHPFAIFVGDDHVGNVVLDKLDRYLGTARLSIYVGTAEARGVGVAQQAIALARAHADEALDLHKLWLTVHTANAAAIAAYARCGFVEEGILRDEFLIDGVRTDILRMGLILGGSAA
jgi:RimJ/RimL family protein N-acetyltransferase